MLSYHYRSTSPQLYTDKEFLTEPTKGRPSVTLAEIHCLKSRSILNEVVSQSDCLLSYRESRDDTLRMVVVDECNRIYIITLTPFN